MKSEPTRSCVACRRKSPRGDLVRFVADGRGHLRPDPGQRMAGRGAYTCAGLKCIERAVQKGGFARGLKRRVAHVEPVALACKVSRGVSEELNSLLDRGCLDGRGRCSAAVVGVEGVSDVDGSGRVVTDPRLHRRVSALVEQVDRLKVDLETNGEVRVR